MDTGIDTGLQNEDTNKSMDIITDDARLQDYIISMDTSIDFFLRRKLYPMYDADADKRICNNRFPIMEWFRRIPDIIGTNEFCIGGGFAAFLTGRTSTYGDIDIFYKPPPFDPETPGDANLMHVKAVRGIFRLSKDMRDQLGFNANLQLTAHKYRKGCEGRVMRVGLETIALFDIPTCMCCVILIDGAWYSLSLTDDGILNLDRDRSYLWYYIGEEERPRRSDISDHRLNTMRRYCKYAERRLEKVYNPSMLSELVLRFVINNNYKNM